MKCCTPPVRCHRGCWPRLGGARTALPGGSRAAGSALSAQPLVSGTGGLAAALAHPAVCPTLGLRAAHP
eukprot:8065192-Alexandrium_andersonii.AAC.1